MTKFCSKLPKKKSSLLTMYCNSCCKLHEPDFVKAGIHYTAFAQIFAPIFSLEESVYTGISKSQPEDFGQWDKKTDFTETHVVYYRHRLVIFTLHIVFICHASSSNEARALCDFNCVGNNR